MISIFEKAYPPATPMPVPEIWKIGPAFPGVPRCGPGGPDPVQSCAAAARLVSYWLHILPLPRPEGQNRGSKRICLTECCPGRLRPTAVGAGSGARVLGKAGGPRAPAPYLNPNSPCIPTATLRNGPVSQGQSSSRRSTGFSSGNTGRGRPNGTRTSESWSTNTSTSNCPRRPKRIAAA